jgi:hypothetical protein
MSVSGTTVKIDDGICTSHVQIDNKWLSKLSFRIHFSLLKYIHAIKMTIPLFSYLFSAVHPLMEVNF